MFLGWLYNETQYSTSNDLRAALKDGTITPAKATVTGEWSRGGAHVRQNYADQLEFRDLLDYCVRHFFRCLDAYYHDPQGRAMPMDVMPPPQAIAPAGSRFSLDRNMKYVEVSTALSL